MKKILAILGAIGLTATTSATVIACGTTETKKNKLNDSVTLKEELRRQMILTLKGEGEHGIDLGDLWDEQKLDTLIDNFIDDEVSKLYTQDVLNANLTNRLRMQSVNTNTEVQFGKDKINDPNINVSIQEVNQINHENSLLNFFTTYTTSISKRKSEALDLDTNSNYGQLNPTKVDDKEVSNVGIYWLNKDNTYTRWTSLSDLDESQNTRENRFKIITGNNIPDQNILSQETGFILVENGTELTLASKPATVLKDNVSGLEALGYRFQTYIRNEIESKNYQTILTTQFMKNEMYRYASAPRNNSTVTETAANQAIYYNPDSDFVRNAQTWDLKPGAQQEENYSTNLKMVWTISINSQTDQAKIIQANNILNTNQDSISTRENDYATYRDKTDSLYKLPENKSTNALEILSLLTALDGKEKAASVTDTVQRINDINQSNKGSDPIFGIKGFQGFIRNSGESSVEAVLGGNLTVAENSKSKIAKVKGSAALKNLINTGGDNLYDFTFDSGDQETRPGYRDIIVVLPVYLIDLWKKVTEPGTTPTESTPNTNPNELVDLVTNTWIELLPQVEGATWQGADPSESAGWTKVDGEQKTYPTQNSYKTIDGKTYIYIYQEDSATNPSPSALTVNGQSITFKFNDQSSNWENTHNYGVTGIGHSNSPMATNGQEVKFNVHLGSDSNLSDYVTNLWAQRSASVKRSDDLAYLTADKKEQLINILLYIIATKEEGITERAKQTIYKMYIAPDDIFYQSLYDRLIRYVKDDKKDTEDSD